MPLRQFATFSALVIALLIPAAPTFGQQPAPAPTATSAAPASEEELATVRAQLVTLVRMSPTLAQVVETDPTILADQEYVARNNPQLAAFLVQHPEVIRNPDFYLFANFPHNRNAPRVEPLRRRTNGNEPPNDEQRQMEIHRQYMDNAMLFVVFIVIIGALFWLIRLLLENRRWSRVFRLQSDIHARLIERFANNQELLQYMNTEPGRRFLEAAPIPIEAERPQRLPGGVSRIIGPLQLGIVLTLLGVGLLGLVHSGSLSEIAGPLQVFGMVALMPGLGFIISAIVTWRISTRLGLLPNHASTDMADRQ